MTANLTETRSPRSARSSTSWRSGSSFDCGTEIVYFGGDPTKIVAEFGATNPSYFPSVPRVFEKIYALTTASFTDPHELRRIIDLGVQVRQMQLRAVRGP